MTAKQTERLRKKIADVKRALAADKRKHGTYDDSRGLRYLPLQYFVALGDYPGALSYLKWFTRNFEDDMGFPDFLFECTIVLFKSGKMKEAEQKAFDSFCSNSYLFDKFFDSRIIPLAKWEGSNLAAPSFVAAFHYSHHQPGLSDFSVWLQGLISSEDFVERCRQYTDLLSLPKRRGLNSE